MQSIYAAGNFKMVSSNPCLGASPAGDDSGSELLSRVSTDAMSLVPPSSAESTQTKSLNSTVQPDDPSMLDFD